MLSNSVMQLRVKTITNLHFTPLNQLKNWLVATIEKLNESAIEQSTVLFMSHVGVCYI